MVLGLFASALLLIGGFLALHIHGWEMGNSWHSKSGYIIFWVGIGLSLSAILAYLIRQKVSLPWNTKGALLMGKAHKWLGRAMVLGSQFANGTGWYHFYRKHRDNPSGGLIWAGVSTGLVLLMLIIGEINHQIKLRREHIYRRPDATMTAQEFKQAI